MPHSSREHTPTESATGPANSLEDKKEPSRAEGRLQNPRPSSDYISLVDNAAHSPRCSRFPSPLITPNTLPIYQNLKEHQESPYIEPLLGFQLQSLQQQQDYRLAGYPSRIEDISLGSSGSPTTLNHLAPEPQKITRSQYILAIQDPP